MKSIYAYFPSSSLSTAQSNSLSYVANKLKHDFQQFIQFQWITLLSISCALYYNLLWIQSRQSNRADSLPLLSLFTSLSEIVLRTKQISISTIKNWILFLFR